MVGLVMERTDTSQAQASLEGAVTPLQRARAYLRTNGLGLAAEVAVNFVLPYVVYDYAKPALGEVGALIASSAPPLVWSLLEFVRRRRVDAVSLLALGGIALSLLAFLGGGSVHVLQLREKLVTALIGFVFLASAAVGRPLIYQLARAGLARRKPSELVAFEALRDNAGFRRSMTLMTLVWGFGLLGEAALSGVLVYVLSVREYLIVGPILGNGAMGALGLWTFWFSRRQRRRRASQDSRVGAASPLVGAA